MVYIIDTGNAFDGNSEQSELLSSVGGSLCYSQKRLKANNNNNKGKFQMWINFLTIPGKKNVEMAQPAAVCSDSLSPFTSHDLLYQTVCAGFKTASIATVKNLGS